MLSVLLYVYKEDKKYYDLMLRFYVDLASVA